MAEEKSSLALQLGEQKGQLNVLQKEIQKLKVDTHIYSNFHIIVIITDNDKKIIQVIPRRKQLRNGKIG